MNKITHANSTMGTTTHHTINADHINADHTKPACPWTAGEHTDTGGGIITRVFTRALRPAFTLLEVLTVLLIAVAIIATALYMAASTISQSEAIQQVQSLNSLGVAVQRLKSSSGYPASASISTSLVTLNLVPANVQVTDGIFYNSWGGLITFTQENSGAGFRINYTNVPTKDCLLFVSSIKQGIFNSFGSAAATMNLSTQTTDNTVTACANGTPSFSTVIQ